MSRMGTSLWSPARRTGLHAALLRMGLIAFGLVAFVTAPARAQWTPVVEVPAVRLFTVRANGDTLTAGADTAVYISTNAGAAWQRSAKPVAGVGAIQSTLMRNGRLYAATAGQGVHVSDNLGATWQAFNQGLVGGFLDSQLDVSDLEVRGDSLYAATEGAGVYVRNIHVAGTWSHFGEAFEPNQASNVNDLALGGVRLLACGGANGQVFRRDPGEADWTTSNLDNVGLRAGVQAYNAAFTGSGWVVGTVSGVFRSVAGQEPWSLANMGLGPILFTAFATHGSQLLAEFDIVNFAVLEHSGDNGATWHILDVLPDVSVSALAVVGDDLYAARLDGLWRRSVATVSVPIASAAPGLRFSLAGPQPFADQTRLRFDLPEAGTATIEVFDVRGRRAADRIEGSWSAGPHEVALDGRRLDPGVYAARLTAAGTSAVVRLVHIR